MRNDRPDDQGGIERRDLLKGLGLGALAATGASASAEAREVVAQGGLISFARFTPPGEDVEDDTIDEFTNGLRGNTTGDLVFSLKLGVSRSVSLGYQITIVDREDNHVVPGTFEEGSSRAFSGIVKSDSSGYARERERISVEGLGPENPLEPPKRYWAVLTVVDYSGVALKESESRCQMDCTSVPFTVYHWMQNPDRND